jgi:hypothetical protein
MAPELKVRGRRARQNYKLDIFSLGKVGTFKSFWLRSRVWMSIGGLCLLIMWQVFAAMLSLEEPGGDSNRGVILQHYAPSVWQIVQHCTAGDPRRRPTAGEVQDMLSA